MEGYAFFQKPTLGTFYHLAWLRYGLYSLLGVLDHNKHAWPEYWQNQTPIFQDDFRQLLAKLFVGFEGLPNEERFLDLLG